MWGTKLRGAGWPGLYLALVIAAGSRLALAEPAVPAAVAGKPAAVAREPAAAKTAIATVAQLLSSGLAHDEVIRVLQSQRGLELPEATVTAATAGVAATEQLALAGAGIGLAPSLELAQAVTDAVVAAAGEPSALASAAQAALLQRRKTLAGPPHYQHDPHNAIGIRDSRIRAWEASRSPEVSPSR